MLDVDLPALVGQVLDRHGLAAEWLTLEVTENIVMADPDRALRILGAIRELGVRLALDDFGTGHASLGRLARLPVDELKMDRSFVQRMADREADAVIVQNTVELGRRLGLSVVGEGVEDAREWEMLERFGCDQAQGHLFSQPRSGPELTRWLQRALPSGHAAAA